MNVFKDAKIGKKFILVIVFLILFNFCCPKRVNAGIGFDDIQAAPAAIFYALEVGVLKFINNIFTNDDYQSETITEEIQSENANGGSFTVENLKIALTPETIIKGKFLLLDANIFKDITSDDDYYDWEEGNNSLSSAKSKLRDVVSGWYYTLRNLAIIALLSVLVYVGIRMIISTVAQDKAKYKTMLKDWLIALCLLIFMHYIMIGILNISSLITDAMGGGANIDHIGYLTTRVSGILKEDYDDEEGTWFNANSYAMDDPDTGEKLTIGDAYAYILVLAGIIGYTFIFAVKYLKREFTIIFLILLGPISCITYPIDKISDGKAQAYNRWFTEFLYQVIIQPFHLLLYIVLIGSAAELAKTNVVYALVCFAVMIPAEKFIKEMFGFKDKLGSPLGAFAGGAVASQMLKGIFSGGNSKAPKGNEVAGKSESDGGSIRENKLKPGLPGEEEGTGTPANYDSENEEEGTLPPGGGDGTDPSENGEENPLPPGGGDDGPSEEEEGNPLPSGDENAGSGVEAENTTGIYSPRGASRFKNAMHGVREHRDKKLMAKYGTKNRGIALAKYAGRKGANIGKRSIKGATTLAGAAALGTLGFMFGQGSKGALAGAAIGAKAGNSINRGISSAYSSAKEYGKEASYAMKDEEARRKARVKQMMKSPDQIEKASQSFSKRNGGKIASTAELNQEMADRARFKEMKLSDSQIDDAMQIYNDNKSILGEDGALSMAYASTNLASTHSAKDFEDPKKVKNMYDTLMKDYDKLGVNKDLADENARDIISNAASTYGIKNPALFVPSRKDAYKSNQANIDKAKASYSRRHGGTGPNKQQLNQELEMGYNLRKAGLTDGNIQEFFNNYISDSNAIAEARTKLGAEATEDELNTELERRFEIKAKIGTISDERELTSYINAAETFVKDNKQIEHPSTGQVYSEVKQRVTVRDSYHISTGSQQEINQRISDIRKDEERFVKRSVDKSGAKAVLSAQRAEAKSKPATESKQMQTQAKYQRDFLAHYSAGQMRDERTMEKAKKKIMKKLKESGANYSNEFMGNFADGVISYGKHVSGIEN